ncbi:MAG: 2-C-methyl-D-erythritol 4-phosphate cytidylyltransferase [candidate division Zixibacteria bacterium]|nr:2-C-methyl-D-erythritol 4-phosphate cytidylyltransferase [candidate division Zixibacteria bacterium]
MPKAPMEKSSFISAIIVAGGKGRRYGDKTPKQFALLGGKPVIQHSLERFVTIRNVKEIIVAIPGNYVKYFREKVLSRIESSKPVLIVKGGRTRQDSVFRAIDSLNPKSDIVIIHDAARPLVGRNEILKLIPVVEKQKAAILAVPASDTVKFTSGNTITKTLPRGKVWLAHTPQGFETKLFRRAVAEARKDGFIGTDCSSLVERLGWQVRVVEDSPKNIKITTKADLRMSESLVKIERQKQS